MRIADAGGGVTNNQRNQKENDGKFGRINVAERYRHGRQGGHYWHDEPEEAIGRSRSLLSASGDRAALRLLRQEIASSRQSASRTLAWECKDGSTRSLMVFLSPVYDSDGRVIGTTEIARAGEAVAQDRTLEQLVHELTEPLTAIDNYLLAGQELLNREAQSDRLKLRTAIQQALRQLTRTINVLHRIRSLAR